MRPSHRFQLRTVSLNAMQIRRCVVALWFVACIGCSSDPQVEIPANPALPPASKPQLLDDGTNQIKADQTPTISNPGGTN